MGRCSLVICSGSPRKTILVVAARRLHCVGLRFIYTLFFFFFFFPLFSFLPLPTILDTERGRRESGARGGGESLFDGDDETFPIIVNIIGGCEMNCKPHDASVVAVASRKAARLQQLYYTTLEQNSFVCGKTMTRSVSTSKFMTPLTWSSFKQQQQHKQIIKKKKCPPALPQNKQDYIVMIYKYGRLVIVVVYSPQQAILHALFYYQSSLLLLSALLLLLLLPDLSIRWIDFGNVLLHLPVR